MATRSRQLNFNINPKEETSKLLLLNDTEVEVMLLTVTYFPHCTFNCKMDVKGHPLRLLMAAEVGG